MDPWVHGAVHHLVIGDTRCGSMAKQSKNPVKTGFFDDSGEL